MIQLINVTVQKNGSVTAKILSEPLAREVFALMHHLFTVCAVIAQTCLKFYEKNQWERKKLLCTNLQMTA